MNDLLRALRETYPLCVVSFILHISLFSYILLISGEAGLFVVDAGGYLEIGKNIFNGSGFSMDQKEPFIPDSLRTPLYPMYLGLSYYLTGYFWPAVLLQLVINSFLPALVFVIGKAFVQNRNVVWAAAAFTAFEPNLLYYTSVVGTEGIFIVLFLLTIWLIISAMQQGREAYFIASVIIIGIASLVRPVGQWLALFYGITYVLWAKISLRNTLLQSLLKGVLYVFIFFLVISPWLIRNYLVFGNPSLSSFTWVNMYVRTSPSVIAIRDNISYLEAYKNLINGAYHDGLIETTDEWNLYGFEMAPELRRRSLEIINSSPEGLIQAYAIAAVSFLTQDNTYVMLHQLGFLPPVEGSVSPSLVFAQQGIGPFIQVIFELISNPSYTVLYLGRLMWTLFTVLSGIGVASLLFKNRDVINPAVGVFLWLIFLYFLITALPATALVDARHRVPVIPIHAIFITLGAGFAWNLMKHRFDLWCRLPAAKTLN